MVGRSQLGSKGGWRTPLQKEKERMDGREMWKKEEEEMAGLYSLEKAAGAPEVPKMFLGLAPGNLPIGPGLAGGGCSARGAGPGASLGPRKTNVRKRASDKNQ